jgi:hypothetical protein
MNASPASAKLPRLTPLHKRFYGIGNKLRAVQKDEAHGRQCKHDNSVESEPETESENPAKGGAQSKPRSQNEAFGTLARVCLGSAQNKPAGQVGRSPREHTVAQDQRMDQRGKESCQEHDIDPPN